MVYEGSYVGPGVYVDAQLHRRDLLHAHAKKRVFNTAPRTALLNNI